MELLYQPTPWSCLPTAFAMVMDVTPKDIFDFLGHDGSEVLYPDLGSPNHTRGFSVAEMVDFAISYLYFPVVIEKENAFGPDCGHLFNPFPEPKNIERIKAYMSRVNGVLLGEHPDTHYHAVAWDFEEQMIYDPVGVMYKVDDFKIDAFIALYP